MEVRWFRQDRPVSRNGPETWNSGEIPETGFRHYTAATYCSAGVYKSTCAVWHQDGLRGGGIQRGLLHRRWHGDSCRSEDRATGALDLAAQQKPLAVLLNFHHLQSVQIDLGSHRPTRICDLPWLAEPPVPGAALMPRTSRGRDHGSFHRTCDRSAGSATATWTSGTKPPPSRVACTATQPRPHPDLL